MEISLIWCVDLPTENDEKLLKRAVNCIGGGDENLPDSMISYIADGDSGKRGADFIDRGDENF